MAFRTILSYEQLKKKLMSVPNTRDRAFLCLTYASLGRVGEIVRHKFDKRTDMVGWTNPPVKKTDLQIKNDLLVIQIQTEKTGRQRLVPVNRHFEAWLVQPILALASTKENFLFNFSTMWGEKVFEKYFGPICRQKIHHLRVWRATHLLQGKTNPRGNPLNPNIVARMGGWTDLKSLTSIYDQSVIEDYEHLLLAEKKEVNADILFGDGI